MYQNEKLRNQKIAVIGENLQVRRGKTIELQDKGLIVSYIHSAVTEKMGKIGVLVALESTADKAKLQELEDEFKLFSKVINSHYLILNGEKIEADIAYQEMINLSKDFIKYWRLYCK